MTGSLFIDGHWVAGKGDSMSSIAPATGASLWSGQAALETQVKTAIEAAHEAFKSWRKLPVEERLTYIQRFTDLLRDNKEVLTEAIAHETGKPLWDAATEAGAMIGKADISLKAYQERTGTEERDLAGTTLRIAHQPHGVMAVIGPFNFPGHLPNGHIIPALIAGNTIVFKPSELTPMVAEKTVALWEQAGLPAGVINLVHGGRDVGETLVSHEKTRGVLFTGGIQAGRAIHQALGGYPEKILALELGGNNPLIVWDAADKVAAARIILRSVYITSGQRCTCSKRLIIEDGPEGDALLSELNALLDSVIVGPPDAQPEPFMGPLISAKAATDVLTAQNMLVEKGAHIIRASEQLDLGKAFISPGLLDVTNASDRPDEEIFGPLLQIIRVKTFDDALEEANNTRFGLAAGLISDKRSLFDQFIRDIQAGIVNWNRQTTGASGAAPFGGIGLSGNHRPAGYYASDYTAWPMASLIAEGPVSDAIEIKGLKS